MRDLEDDLQQDLLRSRSKALEMLPNNKHLSAKDVWQLMGLQDGMNDDNAVVFTLRGHWNLASDRLFYTRIALAMMRAGWSYVRRYKALKVVGADDEDIIQAYGDDEALNELRVRLEYRLDAFEAKREGLLTIAESGDDIAIVRTIYDYDGGDDGQMVLDLRNIIGWHDGSYGLPRMANAMRFGLDLTKPQITAAWNAADVLEARAIAAVLDETKSS